MSKESRLTGGQSQFIWQHINGLECPEETSNIVRSIKDINHILKKQMKRGAKVKDQKLPSQIEDEESGKIAAKLGSTGDLFAQLVKKTVAQKEIQRLTHQMSDKEMRKITQLYRDQIQNLLDLKVSIPYDKLKLFRILFLHEYDQEATSSPTMQDYDNPVEKAMEAEQSKINTDRSRSKKNKFVSLFVKDFNIYHHAANLFKEDTEYLANLSTQIAKN